MPSIFLKPTSKMNGRYACAYTLKSRDTPAALSRGIRTRVLKTRALKDISPKNTIPNGHES